MCIYIYHNQLGQTLINNVTTDMPTLSICTPTFVLTINATHSMVLFNISSLNSLQLQHRSRASIPQATTWLRYGWVQFLVDFRRINDMIVVNDICAGNPNPFIFSIIIYDV